MAHTEEDSLNESLLIEQDEPQTKIGKILTCGFIIGEVVCLILQIVYLVGQSVYRLFCPVKEKCIAKEIVLITGAGRGIGKELAIQYASLGATVVCWGISKAKNQETVDEIARLGYPKAYFYECDVSKEECVIETSKKVQKELGDVTILVNNAGVAYPKPIGEQTISEIENTINVNMMSYFWTIRAFLPSMIKNNHGHIVANSSIAGLVAGKNGLPYCATKFAIRGLMEALYHELQLHKDCKIKLTTVYPFLTHTGIFQRATIRLPKFMPILYPSNVAEEIISAQRRNIFETTIPKNLSFINAFTRLFPMPVILLVSDFLQVTIEG